MLKYSVPFLYVCVLSVVSCAYIGLCGLLCVALICSWIFWTHIYVLKTSGCLITRWRNTHTHTAVCCCCNPHPGFVPFNSFLSWLLCLVIMSAVVSGRFLQRWRQHLMSTSCSLGQPNNENPRELKLNLYRTRFAGKKSRTALCARTTAQHGASILPSHLYLVRILFCWGSSVFTGLILESVKRCL